MLHHRANSGLPADLSATSQASEETAAATRMTASHLIDEPPSPEPQGSRDDAIVFRPHRSPTPGTRQGPRELVAPAAGPAAAGQRVATTSLVDMPDCHHSLELRSHGRCTTIDSKMLPRYSAGTSPRSWPNSCLVYKERRDISCMDSYPME